MSNAVLATAKTENLPSEHSRQGHMSLGQSACKSKRGVSTEAANFTDAHQGDFKFQCRSQGAGLTRHALLWGPSPSDLQRTVVFRLDSRIKQTHANLCESCSSLRVQLPLFAQLRPHTVLRTTTPCLQVALKGGCGGPVQQGVVKRLVQVQITRHVFYMTDSNQYLSCGSTHHFQCTYQAF